MSFGRGSRFPGIFVAIAVIAVARVAWAHPTVENVLDVDIRADQVTVVARVSMEEVLLAEAAGGAGASDEMRTQAARAHGAYVLRHLHVRADGRVIEGKLVESIPPGTSGSKLAVYRMEYALASPPPRVVRLDQDLLREFDAWSASCVVRIRQADQPEYQIALLTREKSVEFDCEWPGGAATRPATTTTAPVISAAATRVRIWPTLCDYFVLGMAHILTGYDHLLFVTALVLAAAGLWDLVKVVSAFTLAHTLTLTLSVLNLVSLPPRVVEPMIAASIVFVALQNVLWPGRRTGWSRLAVAFAFGLFHGLGFAGGLKEAMSGMPGTALGAALGGFSVGVEAGHQIVVLPLFVLMYAVRNYRAARPRTALAEMILRYGSCAISVAGAWFLVRAVW
jgi:hydrogenase/urease accessory protein HupE